MAHQQMAPDIARKFYELVYPHTKGRDPFKLSYGGRGGVSAVLDLQELHLGDVVHSKAEQFAATDRDEVSAKHAVALQLLHHLETQGILPNDWWRWPPDWELAREPGVLRFIVMCALLNMKEGYYTPRKNITTYGISSSYHNLAEAILDDLIGEGSVTQNSMQQVRLASLEEYNRRQQQSHLLQQPSCAAQQPPQPTYVVRYANSAPIQHPVAGYANALPVYPQQQQQAAYSYPTQTQQDYQQPQQQMQQQGATGGFDRRSAWQEARQAAVTAPATTAHAVATACAPSSHAAGVGGFSGGSGRASSSHDHRSAAPLARDQQEPMHSNRYASAAADPAPITTQRRPSWVDERISQWQQQQQPPPPSGGSAINSSSAGADHPYSMMSPGRLEQQRRRSASQIPAFSFEDTNGHTRGATGHVGPPTERRRYRSPSPPPYAAGGSAHHMDRAPYRQQQQLSSDRLAPQRRYSDSSSFDKQQQRPIQQQPLAPPKRSAYDQPEHLDRRTEQQHLAAEQYKRAKPNVDLQQRQQLQPGRWMEDRATVGAAAAGLGRPPPPGAYSADLKWDREPEHRSTSAYSGSRGGNSAANGSGSAAHHARSQPETRGAADRGHSHRYDMNTVASPRSRSEPLGSPRFSRGPTATSPRHRDRSRSSSRHDQLPPAHKRPRHDMAPDRSASGRVCSDRDGAGSSAVHREPGRPGDRISLHSRGSERDRSAVRDKGAAAAGAADKGCERKRSRAGTDASSSFQDRGLDRISSKDRPGDRKHSRERSERDKKGSSNDKDLHRRSRSVERPRDKERSSKERDHNNSRTLKDSRSGRNSSREGRDREGRERSGRDRDIAKQDSHDRPYEREQQRDERGRPKQHPQRESGKQQGQGDAAVSPQQHPQQLAAATAQGSAAADGQPGPAAAPHTPVILPDPCRLETPSQLAAAICQLMSAAAPFAVELSSLKHFFAAASKELRIPSASVDAFVAKLVQEGLLESFEGSDRHNQGIQYVRALHSRWTEAVAEQLSAPAAAASAAADIGNSTGGQQVPGATLAATAAGPAATTNTSAGEGDASGDHAAPPVTAETAADVYVSDAAAAEVATAMAQPVQALLAAGQKVEAVVSPASKDGDDQHMHDVAAATGVQLQETASGGPADDAAAPAAGAAGMHPAAGAAGMHPAVDGGGGNPGIAAGKGASAGNTGPVAGTTAAEAVQQTAANPALHQINQAVDAGAAAPVAAAGATEVVAVVPQAEGMRNTAAAVTAGSGLAEQAEPVAAVAEAVRPSSPAAAAISSEPGDAAPEDATAVAEIADAMTTASADRVVAAPTAALVNEGHAGLPSSADASNNAALSPVEPKAAAVAAAAPEDIMQIIDADDDSNAMSEDEEMPDTVPASPIIGLTAADDAAAAAATDAALGVAAAVLAADGSAGAVGATLDSDAMDNAASGAEGSRPAPAEAAEAAAVADQPAVDGDTVRATDAAAAAGALENAEQTAPQAAAAKAAAAAAAAATTIMHIAAGCEGTTTPTQHDALVLELLPEAAAEEPLAAAAAASVIEQSE